MSRKKKTKLFPQQKPATEVQTVTVSNLYAGPDRKKLYTRIDAGPISAFREIEPQAITEPLHRWTGAKITLIQRREVISFFKWAYDTHKCESLILGFYREATAERPAAWYFAAPTQKISAGLAVDKLGDHPDYAASVAPPEPGDWQPALTWHTHAASSAFQSGHDSQDERGRDGLHLTHGDLDKNQFSWHARINFRGQFTTARLSDWFVLPEPIASYCPLDSHEQILAHELRQPVERCHPEAWETRLVRYVPTASATTYHLSGGVYDLSKLPHHYQNQGQVSWRITRLLRHLAEWSAKHRADRYDVFETLNALIQGRETEAFYDDFIRALVDSDHTPREALKALAQEWPDECQELRAEEPPAKPLEPVCTCQPHERCAECWELKTDLPALTDLWE